MNDKREIKNAVVATVIGSLILSAILWCINHFFELQSELQQKLSVISVWARSSEFITVAIIVCGLLFLRAKLRPTLKSRVSAYRKKIIKLFRVF